MRVSHEKPDQFHDRETFWLANINSFREKNFEVRLNDVVRWKRAGLDGPVVSNARRGYSHGLVKPGAGYYLNLEQEGKCNGEYLAWICISGKFSKNNKRLLTTIYLVIVK